MTELISKNDLISREGESPYYKRFCIGPYVELHPGQKQPSRNFNLDIEIYTDSILKHINKGKKIAFYDIAESFEGQFFSFSDAVCKRLIESKKFNKNQFLIVCGALPLKENFFFYINHCKNNNLNIYPILFVSWFEQRMSKLIETKSTLLANRIQQDTKTHTFLFLNGQARPHRIYTLIDIIKRNLNDKVLYSFGHIPDLSMFPETHKSKIKENLHLLEKIELPATLSIDTKDYTAQHDITPNDLILFDKTYISLITETVFFKSTSIEEAKNFNHLDGLFLTEKTFRTIACKHPFILIARPHSLKALKQLGYNTFSPWIDESYDEIEDDHQRLDKIMDIVEKMSREDQSFWDTFMSNINPIIEQNFKTLTEANYKSAYYPLHYSCI